MARYARCRQTSRRLLVINQTQYTTADDGAMFVELSAEMMPHFQISCMGDWRRVYTLDIQRAGLSDKQSRACDILKLTRSVARSLCDSNSSLMSDNPQANCLSIRWQTVSDGRGGGRLVTWRPTGYKTCRRVQIPSRCYCLGTNRVD